jgi:hypothetical protein
MDEGSFFFSLDLLEYESATLRLAVRSFTPTVARSLPLQPHLFQLVLNLMRVETPCSRLVESPLFLVLHQVLTSSSMCPCTKGFTIESNVSV